MIIDNPEKFEKSKRMVSEFKKENGVGPNGDRFATEVLAQHYSDLLKETYGVYYTLIRIRSDENGFYPEYYPIQ